MKRNLLKESILPAFWLFVFIFSSKSDAENNDLKKAGNNPVNIGIKNQDVSAPGASNSISKNKEATFTKAVYLSGF